MQKGIKNCGAYALLGFLFSLVSSCSTQQTSYQREYNKVWREIVKSEAWKKSLEKEPQPQELYASTDDTGILISEPIKNKHSILFEKEYQSLVSRAYFKIMTEAEKADARISSQYRIVQDQEASNPGAIDKEFKKRKEDISKKYEAHKAMLSGLKSWNIFSENKSGDLDYFKAENREEVEQMLAKGEGDGQVVNFLIYKLADLYHLDE